MSGGKAYEEGRWRSVFIKIRLHYLILVVTIIYWFLALSAALLPSMFRPPMISWNYWRIMFKTAIAIGIINTGLTALMLYLKTWNMEALKWLLILNIAAVLVEPLLFARIIMI